MLRRALPFERGATPVSREIVRKSCRERPLARRGGFASNPAWIYDLSAFEMEVEVIMIVVQVQVSRGLHHYYHSLLLTIMVYPAQKHALATFTQLLNILPASEKARVCPISHIKGINVTHRITAPEYVLLNNVNNCH